MENENKTAAEALIEVRHVISTIEADNRELAASLIGLLATCSTEELQRFVDALGAFQKAEQGREIRALCDRLGVLLYGEGCRRELAEKAAALDEQYVRRAQ